MRLSNFLTPNDSRSDKDEQYDQDGEALLGGCADAHEPGRTFQFAGQFEVFVEKCDPEPGNRQRQRQQVQNSPMPLSSQHADPQDGDDAHDEGALVKA